MDDIAHEMGYARRSSVQRFFKAHLESLSVEDALKLADALEGKGSPPIQREEVLALSSAAQIPQKRLQVSDEALTVILEALLKIPNSGGLADPVAESVAQSLQDILRHAHTDPSILAIPGAIEGAVRFAIAQALAPRPQA